MAKKSWDKYWEKIYSSREWGKYPPEELVRFIARTYYKVADRSKIKILDLGCGTGAAAWYLAREGFTVCGIDGSPTAIEIALKRFAQEKLQGRFEAGDIISLPYADGQFDCVVDIASIQHNSTPHIKEIMAEVHRVLKPKGHIFSMMIARDKSLATWPGMIHFFFTLAEVKKLLRTFVSVRIEYVARTKDERQIKTKFWIVEATK